MSNITRSLLQAAAGAASGAAVYVDDVFSTYLYAGTGATQTITNGIDLAGEGGLVWIKNRDNTGGSGYHFLFDTARSPTNSDAMYYLRSDSTAAQTTVQDGGTNRDFVGWASNGFTLGSPYFLPSSSLNGSSEDKFCSWTFRKQPGFFDVVTYSGDGNGSTAISHNLGSVPGMMIIKRTNISGDWAVYHRGMASNPVGYKMKLNDTSARNYNTSYFPTLPTDSVFYPGSDADVNGSGQTYVAYLFAHNAQDFGTDSDEAIIKCGSYSGNSGSQTIDVGFEPQWVLIKNRGSGSTDWFVVDVMRGLVDGSYVDAALIRANDSASEQTSGAGGARIMVRNNGFGFLTESNLSCNRSGEDYIYVAIRRPHKPASEFAATDLFKVNTATGDDFVSGFPVDMAIRRYKNVTDGPYLSSRLTGPRYMLTRSTAVEVSDASAVWDNMEGWSSGWGTDTNNLSWMWRRAPGFFDVVTYEATGSIQTVNHNLGVTPEMMIVKDRDSTYGWGVWHKDLPDPNDEAVYLDTTAVPFSSTIYNKTLPTSTQFTVNYTSGQYLGLLFATVPGISKVGGYTGSSSDLNIDCGFASGARFILIRRTDSGGGGGSWMLFDSVRGINASANDPYLALNGAGAEISSVDYIEPLAAGFTLKSSVSTGDTNTNGGTFIFLAIA